MMPDEPPEQEPDTRAACAGRDQDEDHRDDGDRTDRDPECVGEDLPDDRAHDAEVYPRECVRSTL